MMIPHEIQNATDPEGLMRSITHFTRTIDGTILYPDIMSGGNGEVMDFINMLSHVVGAKTSLLFDEHFPILAARSNRQNRRLGYPLSLYAPDQKFINNGLRYVCLQHTPHGWTEI